MLGPLTAERSGPGAAQQAQELAAEIRIEIERADDEGKLKQTEARLTEAAGSGGRELIEALIDAAQDLGAHRAQRRHAMEGAAADLRAAAGRLSEALEQLAALLPTERVVGCRVHLESVEETATCGNPEDAQTLLAEIRKETDEIRRIAELSREYRKSRSSAEIKRLTTEAENLLRAAEGSTARRIRSVVEKLDDADSKSLRALARELKTLSARVGNAVRLETAQVLQRSKGKDSDETNDTLRKAFEKDDLSTMAELAGPQARRLGRSKMIMRGAFGVVATLLVAGTVFVLNWLPNRPVSYVLEVADPAAQVTFTLVRDGGVVERVDARSGQPTPVDLAPGSYEIFVNDRYTGRVIHVPDDPRTVSGIPVPTSTGAGP